MESRAIARSGRQDEGRGRSQAAGRFGSAQHALERLLTETDRLGFAPAKINLFLHVGNPAPDGYHPICSLMTFADIGDQLRLSDGSTGKLLIEGPFAAGLSNGADNLVVRASEAALRVSGFDTRRPSFHLIKNLPLASGIGGGSADAAAVLRLIAEHFAIEATTLVELARSLGSDIPVCLESQPALATGRGEQLEPPPHFPALDVVLVNPGVASPTAQTYRAYDAAPSVQGADRVWPGAEIRTPQQMAHFLAECRNDLEQPAARLAPPIGQALELLRKQPETLLARMSGSGATCFALVEHASAAANVESRLLVAQPGWWVRRTVLKGYP